MGRIKNTYGVKSAQKHIHASGRIRTWNVKFRNQMYQCPKKMEMCSNTIIVQGRRRSVF